MSAARESDPRWGSRSALKRLFGLSLGFTPAWLLKGCLAQDLFLGVTPPSIPLLWDPEPTVLSHSIASLAKSTSLTEKPVSISCEIRLCAGAGAWELVTSSSTS